MDKVRRDCERCGHQWHEPDKVGKRDEEIDELHEDFMEMERGLKAAYEELRKDHSRLLHRYMLSQKALKFARYAIECDLWLAEQAKSECPF